jgi:hypothetical protein
MTYEGVLLLKNKQIIIKMKSIKLLLVILFAAFIASAQTVTEPFTKIDLSSVGKVFLHQGDSTGMVVNTSGDREKIRTEVKNGTLIIKSKVEAEYHITMKNIEGLGVSGSGEIISESPINSDNLSLDVSGSGKMTLQLAVKKLNIDISGVGKIILTGTADEAKIDISGSGKVEALELKVTSCTANISGVGKCNIDVTETLNTNISGMGKINYKTKPKNVENDISGVGKINDEKSAGEKNDTTSLRFGKSRVLIISDDSTKTKRKHKSKSAKPIWQGVELGFNNYLNSSGQANLPSAFNFLELNTGKSVSVALNLVQKNVQFGKSNFWFFTGLGISWNNYRFDNNVVLNPDIMINSGYDTTSGRSFQKSKLAASYVTAPLMFEVFSSRKKKDAFHLGAGLMLGYKIGSHTKIKYEEDGHTFKPKTYDDFNLNPFRYGFRVAGGYGKVNLFVDYYASTLFKEGKSPVLYPINFGITLAAF